MSNLTLPPLTYGALAATIRGTGSTPLAYATRARHAGQSSTAPAVIVTHHTTDIATLERDRVHLYAGGYSSRTTSDRMHRVLTDNRTGYGVAIRAGVLSLIRMDDRRTVVGALNRATLERDADGWHVLTLEG